MSTILKKQLSGLGVAAAVGLAGIVPASAGPIPSNAGLKATASDNVIDVRWRRGYGWGVGAGIAAGALFGAAIANSAYAYGPGYYGYAPAYTYGYGPAYYGPYGGYAYSPAYGYYGYNTYRREQYYPNGYAIPYSHAW
jgi:hypothetical protein